MSEEWKNEEPWISIEGALEDVRANQATPAKALEWIRDYILQSYVPPQADTSSDTPTQIFPPPHA